jgi:CheY-like chemotaxis protein
MSPFPILVVEDEPDGQELVARLLSQANLRVEVAGTAEDAWAMLCQQQYAGAIIDLALPGQDGFQLVGAIRQEAAFHQLPCIAVTAFHTSELRQQALQQGFDAYLPKPLNRTLFLSAVEEMLST